MDISEYYPLTEAAEKLGYSSLSSLATYCRAGRVPGAVKFGKTWAIPKAWVEDQRKNSSLAPQGGRGTSRKSSD